MSPSIILISAVKEFASDSNRWSQSLKIEKLKVYLWEFKNNKNSIEIAKKIFSVYGQGVMIDCQVRTWFSKFHSGDTLTRDEPQPGRSLDFDGDALRGLVECNPRRCTRELALDLNTSKSTMCCHLKK